MFVARSLWTNWCSSNQLREKPSTDCMARSEHFAFWLNSNHTFSLVFKKRCCLTAWPSIDTQCLVGIICRTGEVITYMPTTKLYNNEHKNIKIWQVIFKSLNVHRWWVTNEEFLLRYIHRLCSIEWKSLYALSSTYACICVCMHFQIVF